MFRDYDFGFDEVVFFLLSLAFVSLFVWMGYEIYRNGFPISTVHTSWTTKKCVRVLPFQSSFSCENLPPKYHHVWVE